MPQVRAAGYAWWCRVGLRQCLREYRATPRPQKVRLSSCRRLQLRIAIHPLADSHLAVATAPHTLQVVPIVKTIGLAMGLLIWGMANMLMGWASGRFGLFGLTPDTISNPTLNDIGVLFACAALAVYFFLKPEDMSGGAGSKGKSLSMDDDHDAAYAGLYKEGNTDRETLLTVNGDAPAAAAGGADEETTWTDKLSPKQKMIFGVGASVLSGIFYGCNL